MQPCNTILPLLLEDHKLGTEFVRSQGWGLWSLLCLNSPWPALSFVLLGVAVTATSTSMADFFYFCSHIFMLTAAAASWTSSKTHFRSTQWKVLLRKPVLCLLSPCCIAWRQEPGKQLIKASLVSWTGSHRAEFIVWDASQAGLDGGRGTGWWLWVGFIY